MKAQEFLDILSVAAKLKMTTRHCMTTEDRQESVAEHSWRLALMAMLLSGEEEFQKLDMGRVIRMCLIHDLGEAFTGDIPAFMKTEEHVSSEDELLDQWIRSFPEPQKGEWLSLLREMNALETEEARTYKALDKLEAIISHDESAISTWLPLEYDLQLTYGQENMRFSPFLSGLRRVVDEWTRRKIREEGEQRQMGPIVIEPIDIRFSICKVADYSGVDLDRPFCFIGRTDEEKSLVCPEADVPENTTERNDGWRAFRIAGQLDFSLTGILARISKVLAENEIGIFAISTYRTDYVLTKAEQFERALEVLENAGYTV